jgi:hypothetical protein
MTTAEAEAAADIDLIALGDSAMTGEGNSCFYVRPQGGPAELAFMVSDDRIVRIDVDALVYQDMGDEAIAIDTTQESQIRTPEGIGLGTTEAEVMAAYPDAEITPHKYVNGNYLTITAPNQPERSIVFEVNADQGNQVVSFRSGQLPEVRWVEGCS